jgi:predicted nucleic acid-binding protein
MLDTNIVLNVLLDQPGFASGSAAVLALAEEDGFEGFLCATTMTTLYYLVRKHRGQTMARRMLRDLASRFTVAPVDGIVIDSAIKSPLTDFEDAVLLESARSVGVERIITRNLKDFKASDIAAMEPEPLLALWSKSVQKCPKQSVRGNEGKVTLSGVLEYGLDTLSKKG